MKIHGFKSKGERTMKGYKKGVENSNRFRSNLKKLRCFYMMSAVEFGIACGLTNEYRVSELESERFFPRQEEIDAVALFSGYSSLQLCECEIVLAITWKHPFDFESKQQEED